jgi:ADP-heptose:LPS heptosyltransferase
MLKESSPEWIVVFTDFGMGDCLLSTVAFRNLRKKYPNIPIISASVYSDLHRNNPNITLNYQLGDLSDLYERWVKPIKSVNQVYNLKVYERPYQRLYDGPLSKLMCEMLDVDFDEDRPEVFLSKDEEDFGKDFVGSYLKPVVLIQVESARPPIQGNKKMINEKDMVGDFWEKLVDKIKDKVDIIQVGCKDERSIQGIKTNLLGKTTVRQTFSILKYCKTFICIDSLLGHAGPAVGKKGIVLYGRSKIKTLAHDSNDNIIVRDSCPDIECCRPEPQFGDIFLNTNAKGERHVTNWGCMVRKCMIAITPELVESHLNKILS